MKIYAITSQKGGTGKTTTAGNVGWRLSEKHNVLLVDADRQANLTQWLCKESFDYDIGDVLMKRCELPRAIVQISEGLYILPMRKNSIEFSDYSEIKIFNDQNRFKRMSKEFLDIGFDYVLYDLPPAMTKIERAIIASSHEAVTPVNPDIFGISGMAMFATRLNEINDEFDGNAKHRKIVINEINMSYKGHRETLDVVQRLDYELFVVPQDVQLTYSQASKMPTAKYNPDAKCIEAINKLAEAMM